MTEIEKRLSNFLSKDPSHPVMVEIRGETTNEMCRRIVEVIEGKDLAEPVPTCPADCPGNIKEPKQTVTIPLEAYAQMLRSHTQLETLRVAWHDSRGDLVWLLLRTMFGEEPRGDSDAK